jgi:hypothetical protein
MLTGVVAMLTGVVVGLRRRYRRAESSRWPTR